MNWKATLLALAHALAGAGAAAGLAVGAAYLNQPGINPLVAAAIGSALSSLASAFSKPPTQ